MSQQTKVVLYFTSFLVASYALISSAGVFAFGQRSGLRTLLVLLLPLLTVPIEVLAYFRLRASSVLMWIIFLLIHAAYVVIDWPHPENLWLALAWDWPVLLSAVLLTMGAHDWSSPE